VDGLSAAKSEGVGLSVRAISFQDIQPMWSWSWSTNITDGQTDGQHATSIPRYALVHRAVKTGTAARPTRGRGSAINLVHAALTVPAASSQAVWHGAPGWHRASGFLSPIHRHSSGDNKFTTIEHERNYCSKCCMCVSYDTDI